MDKSEKTIIYVVIGIVAACSFCAILCVALFLFTKKFTPTITPSVATPAMPTPAMCTLPMQDSKTPPAENDPLLDAAYSNRDVLTGMTLPTANLNEIAGWLNNIRDIPTHLDTPPVQYQIGDRLSFYKLDGDNNEILTTATLRYATDTVYFWAEEDILLDKRDLKTMVDIFSNEIYPINHAFFGTEAIPGVDNDPHLFILYARGLGDSISGYFSSEDYVLPVANQYSNAHEMFFINADEDGITDPYTLGTMAHELQHVIMGTRDPNEDLWLNEGFSELATLINGYDEGGFDYWFTLTPDMQLNDWSPDADLNDLNYGASYMFTTYLLSRFGDEITKAVSSDPLNGFESIDHVFQSYNVVDPSTNSIFTADEFFRDWTITNFVNDPDLQNGRYYYSRYESVPTIDDSDWLNDCQGTKVTEEVHQYGTDYYQIGCSQRVNLTFSAPAETVIFPDGGENQSSLMWSNRGDSADTTLTREFDLTGFSGPITFRYKTWFDLEDGFDYVYLVAKPEGGDWQVLPTKYCPDVDVTSPDCSYTGHSQNWSWQNQSVDLSRFAGQKISLRFEMVSDGGVSYEGFAVDDISIPEIGYVETFEEGDGDWVTNGFARIRNLVPQSFLVSLITSDPETPISKYLVNAGEELNLLIDPNCLTSNPILVVSGNSRFTRQTTQYSITLTE